MKAVALTIRLYYFYLTYKGIKTLEIRKKQPKDFNGIVYECVSKTNWKKDLLKIPENEREFFKKFVGKIGLKFTLNKVEEIEVGTQEGDIKGYYGDCYFSCGYQPLLKKSCLCPSEIIEYAGYDIKKNTRDKEWRKKIYAWHIDNLEILEEPMILPQFKHLGTTKEISPKQSYSARIVDDKIIYYKTLTKAPQSWCYVEVEVDE